MPYRILCLGNLVVDILARPVNRLPPRGGLSLVSDIHTALGGCASNTALGLGRLGARVSLWAKVGRDQHGDFALGELKAGGVEVSGVLRDPRVPTAATVVLIDSKANRSFLHSVAANAELKRSEVRDPRLKAFDHLHVGGYFLFPGLDGAPMGSLLKKARSLGLSTSLDTAWDIENRWMKALKPCLPYLDYFMPSEREVAKLIGHCRPRAAGRFFVKRGVGCFILKMGKKGSYVYRRDGLEAFMPGYRAREMDSTGAGDAFCAGFIKGLSLGWNLLDSVKLGNAAGAAAVSALGATTGIKSFVQLLRITQGKRLS